MQHQKLVIEHWEKLIKCYFLQVFAPHWHAPYLPTPALGPAVLRWGGDVASLPPYNVLRLYSVVWPWHMSSIWPSLGAPKVQLYGTVVSGLGHLPPWMKNQHGFNAEKNLYRKQMSLKWVWVMKHVWLVWILTTKRKEWKTGKRCFYLLCSLII